MDYKKQTVKGRHVEEEGYAMAALLVTLLVMGVLSSIMLPSWSQAAKREREAELVFRGEQYSRAIRLFQKEHPGVFPLNLETLVEQRFLRRLYKDPMIENGEFLVLYQATEKDLRTTKLDQEPDDQAGIPVARPTGGIIGVVSKSTKPSLLLYNGSSAYSEWEFIHATSDTEAGLVGLQKRRIGPSVSSSVP
jgi:type II secretory pathway pseudopilin PulG